MSVHHIEVPLRLQRPQCSCGWTPDLPWPVSWAQFDADAEAHLDALVDCPTHGPHPRSGNGQCPLCASDRAKAAWAARRAHYPTPQPQPKEQRKPE